MENHDSKTVELFLAEFGDDSNIFTKKMFGCHCIYYDSVPVGWISNGIFWLKNVGCNDLYINDYLREKKDLRQIPISAEQFHLSWLKEIVIKTADVVKLNPKKTGKKAGKGANVSCPKI